MNNKQERLALKCVDIKPLEGRIIVIADRVRSYKGTGFESKPVDPDVKEEDIVQGETEMALEEVETKVNYRYQTAVVLQTPEDEIRFDVGDTVLYDIGSLVDFDFVRGTSMIRKFDVVAVIR